MLFGVVFCIYFKIAIVKYIYFRKSTGRPSMKNILETAIDIGNFNTLIDAIKIAKLEDFLNGPGPFTFLAPQDSAFATLPELAVDELLKDKSKLEEILKFHVVSGKYELSELRKLSEMQNDNNKIKTMLGKELKITSTILCFCSVDLETVKFENAVLIRPDINCSNGIFHTIDKVLLPK